jgi:hypothetical protein
VIRSPADDDDRRACVNARARNRFADPGATARDNDDTSFKSKIQGHSVKILSAG